MFFIDLWGVWWYTVGNIKNIYTYIQHVDENQYIFIRTSQRAAGGCEAVMDGIWNSFRSGRAEPK
jgi:hypothetical protein